MLIFTNLVGNIDKFIKMYILRDKSPTDRLLRFHNWSKKLLILHINKFLVINFY